MCFFGGACLLLKGFGESVLQLGQARAMCGWKEVRCEQLRCSSGAQLALSKEEVPALPFHSTSSPKTRLALTARSLLWYKPQCPACLGLTVGLEGAREAGEDTRGPGISSCDPRVTPTFPQGRIPQLAPCCSIWKAELPWGRSNLNIPGSPQGCFCLPFWHPKICKDSAELQELIVVNAPSRGVMIS